MLVPCNDVSRITNHCTLYNHVIIWIIWNHLEYSRNLNQTGKLTHLLYCCLRHLFRKFEFQEQLLSKFVQNFLTGHRLNLPYPCQS